MLTAQEMSKARQHGVAVEEDQVRMFLYLYTKMVLINTNTAEYQTFRMTLIQIPAFQSMIALVIKEVLAGSKLEELAQAHPNGLQPLLLPTAQDQVHSHLYHLVHKPICTTQQVALHTI